MGHKGNCDSADNMGLTWGADRPRRQRDNGMVQKELMGCKEWKRGRVIDSSAYIEISMCYGVWKKNMLTESVHTIVQIQKRVILKDQKALA